MWRIPPPAAIQCMSPSARISALMAGRTLLSLCCRARATHTKGTCMRNIPWDVMHPALQEGGGPSGPAVGLRVDGHRDEPRAAKACVTDSVGITVRADGKGPNEAGLADA